MAICVLHLPLPFKFLTPILTLLRHVRGSGLYWWNSLILVVYWHSLTLCWKLDLGLILGNITGVYGNWTVVQSFLAVLKFLLLVSAYCCQTHLYLKSLWKFLAQFHIQGWISHLECISLLLRIFLHLSRYSLSEDSTFQLLPVLQLHPGLWHWLKQCPSGAHMEDCDVFYRITCKIF